MPTKKCPCGKNPVFNFPGQTKRICCKICKSNDMINVVSKKYRKYCSCGKRSVFNVPGETKGICCKDCKTDGMVNVVDKKCPCGKRPKFNVHGESKGVCCAKCKTDEMIDVVSPRCLCGKRPYYNVPGETRGVCCAKCKTDDMVDVMNKICPGYIIECPVRTRVGDGRDYCLSCDPDDARRNLYKCLEGAFFDYVKDKLDVKQREFRVTFDQNETAKKFARLDGIVIDDDVIVCLEIDENGHHNYECDEHRMHLVTAELLKSYPEHVVSWVRVNPTVGAKSQWSKTSKKIREKLFEDAVNSVKDILKMRDTCVKYIGTYDM